MTGGGDRFRCEGRTLTRWHSNSDLKEVREGILGSRKSKSKGPVTNTQQVGQRQVVKGEITGLAGGQTLQRLGGQGQDFGFYSE